MDPIVTFQFQVPYLLAAVLIVLVAVYAVKSFF